MYTASGNFNCEVTEEIGDLCKFISIISTFSNFAPNVIPAVPSLAVHVTIPPSPAVWVNPVTTVSPTLINPSFLYGLPIVASLSESSTWAAPEERALLFSPSIRVGEAKIFALLLVIFASNQFKNYPIRPPVTTLDIWIGILGYAKLAVVRLVHYFNFCLSCFGFKYIIFNIRFG